MFEYCKIIKYKNGDKIYRGIELFRNRNEAWEKISSVQPKVLKYSNSSKKIKALLFV